ncbi:MAG: TatD family deoxyribonuclease [Desulfobacteraceae bacterium]|nr:MAG: TatD family deoxyribonuclease [Desulfobacteraceae bacterium]
MQIFDSHCHLDDHCYDRDLESVVQRARQADVQAIMVVGIDLESSRRAVAIAHAHEGLYAAVGLHPHDAKSCEESLLAELSRLANDFKVKAWGETGLDFNRMYSPRRNQEICFARQLEMGGTLNLPMIFHERDSQGRFLEILKIHWGTRSKGVVHCFSGNDAELDAYLEMGLYIGITGILTIQTRGKTLREMARRIPAERLLVETDAPYLTPTPERNKFRRNEPAFVRTVLFKLAEVRQEPPETIAQATWANTRRLFGI